jgi:hypothetical protein
MIRQISSRIVFFFWYIVVPNVEASSLLLLPAITERMERTERVVAVFEKLISYYGMFKTSDRQLFEGSLNDQSVESR